MRVSTPSSRERANPHRWNPTEDIDNIVAFAPACLRIDSVIAHTRFAEEQGADSLMHLKYNTMWVRALAWRQQCHEYKMALRRVGEGRSTACRTGLRRPGLGHGAQAS